MRTLKYREALSEGLVQAMEADPSIFVTGISINYSSHVFGTTKEAAERFPDRVITTPAMENALTGICIGAAAMGKRPVIVHDRADFSFLAMDQIINLAAKWKYMFGGNAGSVPVVTRMIIGRGWGQGATHSQALHSLYGHFPGLAVAMPATPYAAKGVTMAALAADHPTIILEHRSLFEIEGQVPEEPMAKFIPRHFLSAQLEGKHITIVATSHMVIEALAAERALFEMGITVDIIDPIWIRPLNQTAILNSVRRTGRLLVADVSHELCGFASEVSALVAEKAFASLKGPIRRLTLPDCPAPVAQSLEDAFYPRASTIVGLALEMLGRDVPEGLATIDRVDSFKGPY